MLLLLEGEDFRFRGFKPVQIARRTTALRRNICNATTTILRGVTLREKLKSSYCSEHRVTHKLRVYISIQKPRPLFAHKHVNE
jgi:hypothetical protein